MKAYEEMLGATSTDESPWYVIPADQKWLSTTGFLDKVDENLKKAMGA